MKSMYNIFIEGIPGSGKSTLLNALAGHFPEYKVYREGDISPVELAWCAYINEGQYERLLHDMGELKDEVESKAVKEGSCYIVPYTKIYTENKEFYEYMENYEVYGGRREFLVFKDTILQRFHRFCASGNIFECSFFQNIIEELMLFAVLSDEEIIGFYKEIISLLDMSRFKLIRLVPGDIELSIKTIKSERVNEKGEEDWYALMINYLSSAPYYKTYDVLSFKDLTAHFRRRIKLEDKVISLLPNHCLINVKSKNYDISDILDNLQVE